MRIRIILFLYYTVRSICWLIDFTKRRPGNVSFLKDGVSWALTINLKWFVKTDLQPLSKDLGSVVLTSSTYVSWSLASILHFRLPAIYYRHLSVFCIAFAVNLWWSLIPHTYPLSFFMNTSKGVLPVSGRSAWLEIKSGKYLNTGEDARCWDTCIPRF